MFMASNHYEIYALKPWIVLYFISHVFYVVLNGDNQFPLREHLKLDGVAPLVADPQAATPPPGKMNPF